MSAVRFYRTIGLLLLAGYAWLILNLLLDGSGSDLPRVCLFRDITGIPCPSCGTTRALMLLVRGKVTDSFYFNPFGFFIAIGMGVLPFWLAYDWIAGKTSFHRWYSRTEKFIRTSKWKVGIAMVLVLSNWIWNITKGS
ncbi:MAG TPA: DUF2752 domain-containing protein [Bacteroidota bacterium]|nr:DUF2752 domain-containing protein [Bacteroidota bacterium]